MIGKPTSPPQYVREHQWRDDRGVAFDDVLRGIGAELAPGDLLVRDGAGVGAVARRRVADLAEVAPERDVRTLQVLVQHWDDADREVTRDAAGDLEEADRRLLRRSLVVVGERHHVLDP